MFKARVCRCQIPGLLGKDRRSLFARYRSVDVARKVVGVGTIVVFSADNGPEEMEPWRGSAGKRARQKSSKTEA